MIAEENLVQPRVLRLEASGPPPIRNLSLAVVAGALMTLAFPGWEAWILAWVALAPLIAAVVRERSGLRSFGLGWLAGTIFFYGSCSFIAYPPIHYGGFPVALAYGLAVIPCAVSGAFFGLFGLITNIAFRRLGPYTVLAAPLTWVACEYLRFGFTGVGWNLLGYSLSFQPMLTQAAALGGVYLVSALVATTSTTLAFVLVAPSRRAATTAMAITLVILVANVCFGLWALRDKQTETGVLNVLAVQPNIAVLGPDADYQTFELAKEEALERLSGMSMEEGLAPGTLIVWPEIPVGIDYETDASAQQFATEAASFSSSSVLLNGLGAGSDSSTTNSALLVGRDGSTLGQYDKVRLMPFGEYVPMRSVIPFLDQVPALAGEFTPGESVHLLNAEGTPIAVSICFESAFPELAREASLQGAAGLVNLTNDAWFGPTAEPRQHLAHAVMRSVETRLPQVRVTNSGYSAWIDARGRIADVTPAFEQSTRRWMLPRTSEPGVTLYTRFGDWFPILSLMVALLIASLGLLKTYKARSTTRASHD